MKKELLLPLIIGLLILTVGVLSFLLLFFRKQPQLIRHKIKLGLIILSLQALVSGCGSAVESGEEISCYAKPIEPDIMSLVNSQYVDGKYIYHKEKDSIRVNVSDRKSMNFSFAIVNKEGVHVTNGDLKPKDQKLDKEWEELFVYLPVGLEPGDYQLVFYNCRYQDTVEKTSRRASYPIVVL